MALSRSHGLMMSVALALSLASCSPSKVAQCNSFAEVINQAQGFKDEFEGEINDFTKQASGAKNLTEIQAAATQYIGAVDKVVGNIDGMSTSLTALKLPDEQLAKYRDDYAGVITNSGKELKVASEAMQLVADAKSEADLGKILQEFQSKANTAFGNLQSLSGQEAQLVSEINNYCGAEGGAASETQE